MSEPYVHLPGLRLSFTPAEFETLCREARKRKRPVREFTEWMVKCFIKSVQSEEPKRGIAK